MTAELNRIEQGRKKNKVTLRLEADMDRLEMMYFRNVTLGEYYDEQ